MKKLIESLKEFTSMQNLKLLADIFMAIVYSAIILGLIYKVIQKIYFEN